MDLSSHAHEEEIPAIPITSPYVVHEHHHPSNRLLPLSTTTTNHNNNNTDNDQDKKSIISLAKVGVKYRECLKNHAASIGGNATDGCGEFMPSGEEGTLEAFKCSACNCHRNFHRKEVEGDHHHHHHHQQQPPSSNCHEFYLKGRKGVLISGPSDAFGYISRPPPPPPQLIMPLGAIQTSESDEMEMGRSTTPMNMKKRFRTKFTQEQKEKMVVFAEKVGWRLQRQEEGLVQQFCQEIGVKRRVLKVWMHNNKHNLAKKSSSSSTTLQLQ